MKGQSSRHEELSVSDLLQGAGWGNQGKGNSLQGWEMRVRTPRPAEMDRGGVVGARETGFCLSWVQTFTVVMAATSCHDISVRKNTLPVVLSPRIWSLLPSPALR